MNSSSAGKKRVLLFTSSYFPLIGGSEVAIKEAMSRIGGIYFDIITPRFSRAHLSFEQSGNIYIYRLDFKAA